MKKLSFILATAASTSFFAACGSSSTDSKDQIVDIVKTVDELPSCTGKSEGNSVLVLSQSAVYVCNDGKWVDADEASEYVSSSSSGKKDYSSSSSLSAIDSTLQKCAPEFSDMYMTYNGMTYRCYDNFWRPKQDPPKDSTTQVICLKTTDPNAPLFCYLDTAIWSSSSYVADPEDFVDQGVIKIKDGSITGVAQKGPYLQGSGYRIIPLDGKTLEPTGDTLNDQFNNSKGTYTFCGLNLPSQYAMIEASGYYRSELAGNKSNLQMAIAAIVDVQKGANINVITNLEYERVKYLVQNEGYNIAGAKKRALVEVLSAFHIENVTGSAEQLDITQGGEANGALLAISIMVQGVVGSEFNVVDMMKDFREDLKDDGQWSGETARTKIADIAYEADRAGRFPDFRHNIEAWKLSDTVPVFEPYINDFWGSEFGIGKCSESRFGEIKKNQNAVSVHAEDYFICDTARYSTNYEKSGLNVFGAKKIYRWRYIGQFEYNTRNNVCDVVGLVIPGNIDKDKYYVCSAYGWREATDLEVDIYYTDCTQDGKLHEFSDGKTYKCSDDRFIEANSLDAVVGFGCVSYLEGRTTTVKNFVHPLICENSSWKISEGYSKDNCAKDGSIQELVYNSYGSKKGFVCDADTFRVATGADTVLISALGAVCVSYLEGRTTVKDSVHPLICENGSWKEGYPKDNCAKDGSIQELVFDFYGSKKGLVCDADTFRIATRADTLLISALGAVCVSYLDGKKVQTSLDVFECFDGRWAGSLLDSRDGQTYKIVQIGSQTWMAENLNYAYNERTAKSYCYNDEPDSCAKYGRLYQWSAAMDSAAVFSDAGKGCGYGDVCSRSGTVRGVCPEGWHLPSIAEFETLVDAVGGAEVAGKALKSVSGWYGGGNSGNGTDSYGFSALPAGFRFYSVTFDDVSFVKACFLAGFWSAAEAYTFFIRSSYDDAGLYKEDLNTAKSVRCLRDSSL